MTEHTLEHAPDANNTRSTPQIITPSPNTSSNAIQKWLRQLYLQHGYHGDVLSITVEEFLRILETTRSNRDRSWLSEDQLTLPMVLQLNEMANQSDMVIVTPSAASSLASIGMGINDTEFFLSQAGDLLEAISKPSVRWVVVPCNDGMIQMVDAHDRYGKARGKPAVEANTEEEAAIEYLSNQQDNNEASRHTRVTRSATAVHQAKEKPPKVRPTRSAAAEDAGNHPRPDNRSSNIISHATANQGMHWAMMVIDKDTDDARFLDGDLKVIFTRKDGSSKTRIQSKWPSTAVAAGKILCGYDKVMGKPKGAFKTGTIKHTPHDHQDNSHKGDEGSSCAPWVFAMFRYILQNPTLLTNGNGLKGHFAKSQRQRHVNSLAFNSKIVRHDMQSLIAEQARQSEAANTLPHKLNEKVLQTIGAITPKQLLRHLHDLEDRSIGGRRIVGSSWVGGNNSDDGDGFIHEYKGISFDELKHYIISDSDLTSEESLRDAHARYVEQQKAILDSVTIHRGDKQVNDQENDSTDGNDEPRPNAVRYSACQDSAAFKAIADQAVDFTRMDDSRVDQWLAKNSGHNYLRSGMKFWRKKACLQRAFGGIDESTVDKFAAGEYRHHLNMSSNWGHGQVIDALRVLTWKVPDLRGQIQRYPDYYLQEHGVIKAKDNGYDHGAGRRRRENGRPGSSGPKASKKSSGDDADVDGQSSDDSQDAVTQSYQRAVEPHKKRDKQNAPEVSGSGDTQSADVSETTPSVDNAQINQNRAYTTDQHNKRTRTGNNTSRERDGTGRKKSHWDHAHEMPSGLLDFRTMLVKELEKHIQTDMLNDDRLHEKNVNTTSWRAYLFVTVSKKHFGEESDHDCLKLWLQDSVVFTDEDRATLKKDLMGAQKVRDRMNTYYRTSLPTEMPGTAVNDTEEDLGDEQPSPRLGGASGNTSHTTSKRKGGSREDTPESDTPSKRKRTRAGKTIAAGSREQRADRDLKRFDNAPEALQDDALPSSGPSSPLSSLSSSEDEQETTDEETSSGSNDSDSSDHQDGAASSGSKRSREDRDDDQDVQGFIVKRTKTSCATSSNDTQNDTNGAGSSTAQPAIGAPASPTALKDQVGSSFDSQATLEDPTVSVRIGRTLYIIPTTDLTTFLPQSTTRGAASLPDFAYLSVQGLRAWYKPNRRLLDTQFGQRGQLHDIRIVSAMLHMLFHRTFVHEPDRNFSAVWINDPTVFDAAAQRELRAIQDPDIRNGEIRRRMMEAYEPEVLRRIETTGSYRPTLPSALDVSVFGAPRAAAFDEAQLRLPPAGELTEASRTETRSEEDTTVLRKSTRRKKPSRRYED